MHPWRRHTSCMPLAPPPTVFQVRPSPLGTVRTPLDAPPCASSSWYHRVRALGQGHAHAWTGRVSGVWCLSAWSRFHRTHRIRPPRPGWAGRRHTAAGEASIALLSSPPRSPPPSPGSPLPSAGRHTARAGRGELAAFRLPEHCTVLGRWRTWDAGLQARHALHCLRAVSGQAGRGGVSGTGATKQINTNHKGLHPKERAQADSITTSTCRHAALGGGGGDPSVLDANYPPN